MWCVIFPDLLIIQTLTVKRSDLILDIIGIDVIKQRKFALMIKRTRYYICWHKIWYLILVMNLNEKMGKWWKCWLKKNECTETPNEF